MAGLGTIDRNDLAVGVAADEFEASEVEEQCASQPGIASPLGSVAALLVVEAISSVCSARMRSTEPS